MDLQAGDAPAACGGRPPFVERGIVLGQQKSGPLNNAYCRHCHFTLRTTCRTGYRMQNCRLMVHHKARVWCTARVRAWPSRVRLIQRHAATPTGAPVSQQWPATRKKGRETTWTAICSCVRTSPDRIVQHTLLLSCMLAGHQPLSLPASAQQAPIVASDPCRKNPQRQESPKPLMWLLVQKTHA